MGKSDGDGCTGEKKNGNTRMGMKHQARVDREGNIRRRGTGPDSLEATNPKHRPPHKSGERC